MEIIVGIIILVIVVIVIGKLIGPPKPSTLSDEQIISKIQSVTTWINKYNKLPFSNQQGEGIKKQHDGKKEYLHQLTLELEKRTSNTPDLEELKESLNEEDKIVLLIAELFETTMGFPKLDALNTSVNIVKETLSSFPSNSDPYYSKRGDELIKKEGYIEPRKVAGLTEEEFLSFWNRPAILIACEEQIFKLIQYTNLQTAEEQGKDLWEASNNYKKYTPRFGDPQKWDIKEKQNSGLTSNDVTIYSEFSCRINDWISEIDEDKLEELIDKNGTLNATFSHLLKEGEIENKAKCGKKNNHKMYINHIVKYLSSNGRLINKA